jgi:hypothetical protein
MHKQEVQYFKENQREIEIYLCSKYGINDQNLGYLLFTVS